MLRMPMIIFNETVVAGTVLFLTSLLCGAFAPLRTIPDDVERSSRKVRFDRERSANAKV
jgi:hypothetical protein